MEHKLCILECLQYSQILPTEVKTNVVSTFMPTHSGSDSPFAQAAHSSSNLHVGLLCLLKKETHMHACINTHTHASNSAHLDEQFKSSSSKA